jgi:hypothetical protein
MQILLKAFLDLALVLPVLLFVTLSGCFRPVSQESSMVSLAVPSQIGQSTSPGVLSHAIINITGAGIVEPIVQTWDAHDESDIPTSFTLQVPNGEGRLIQFLGVYKNSTEGMSIYYGDVLHSIKINDETINIPVASLSSGAAIEGHISGRYLTSAEGGPTGAIKVKFFPPNKPSLLIMRDDIYNGWFNLFILDGDPNLKMGYELPDGTMLWGRPVSLMDAEFQPGPAVLRAALPLSYFQRNEEETPTWVLKAPSSRLFGWFGPGAGEKVVCRGDSEINDLATLPALSMRTVGLATAPSPSANPAELPGAFLVTTELPSADALGDSVNFFPGYRVKGGLETQQTRCTSGTEASDKMTLGHLYSIQLNSDGESSGYHQGLFKNQLSWDQKRMVPVEIILNENDFQVSGEVNSGLRGPYFDRLKFYKRVGLDDWNFYEDRTPCGEISRGAFGFLPSGEAVLTTDSFTELSLGLTAADTRSPNLVNVAVCPAQGESVLAGGFILGPWNFLSYGDPANFEPAKLALDFFGNKIANNICTPFFLNVENWSGESAVISTPLNLNFEIDMLTRSYTQIDIAPLKLRAITT